MASPISRPTPATSTFAVTAVNDAPVATDDVLSSVAEDSGTRIISFASLLANDSKGRPTRPARRSPSRRVSNAVGGTAAINGTTSSSPRTPIQRHRSFDYTVQDNGKTNGVDDFKTDTGHVSASR